MAVPNRNGRGAAFGGEVITKMKIKKPTPWNTQITLTCAQEHSVMISRLEPEDLPAATGSLVKPIASGTAGTGTRVTVPGSADAPVVK
jgi:hypothetical protein